MSVVQLRPEKVCESLLAGVIENDMQTCARLIRQRNQKEAEALKIKQEIMSLDRRISHLADLIESNSRIRDQFVQRQA